MDIMVTGTTGFIGRHLARTLAKDHTIYALCRRPCGLSNEILHDLRLPLPIERLPSRIDMMIHTAGLVGDDRGSYSAYYRVNVEATSELLEYAVKAKAQRFLFFSTGGVYRRTCDRLSEDSETGPEGMYAQSKLHTETIVRAFSQALSVQVLRLFFPYGPDQRTRLIPQLIKRIRQGEPIRLHNTIGQPIISPVYIDDLIEFVRRLLAIHDSLAVNVAGSEAVSIRTLAEMIGRILDRPVQFAIQSDVPGVNWWGDNRLLLSLTDYNPQVLLEEGIARMIQADVVSMAP